MKHPRLRSPFALALAFGILALAPGVGSGQTPGDSGGTAANGTHGDGMYVGAAGDLRVATPRLDDPDVDVDGYLDEAVWERAAVLGGFTQYEPSEGIPAREDTEVRVFVARDAIYFGVRALDSGMGEIRATLAERDEYTRNDDFVRFILDTFDDQRRAYVFSVNPYGVQHDGLWVEGGGGHRGYGPPIDENPDFIWESSAHMGDGGWTAEVKIPFKSLRFPERDVQSWGFNVTRTIQRRGFQQSWAPLTSDVANKLTQSGHLEGLQDLDAGMFLEINPVATGKRVGLYDEEVGALVDDGLEEDFGLNVTYGLTSNLTLDGTVNPDFSQVEADAGQIAVNERFALFFPEKRPFFLEGTEIFSLPKQLIYTRSIVDPVAGAKLTGKVGSLNVGYLGAVDDVDDGSDAVVNIVRARKDIGESSTLGMLYTDRTRSGAHYNRMGGLDARFVLGGRYTLTLLGAGSRTADPGSDEGQVFSGSYLVAGLQRAGRTFSFSAEVEDAAPDFRAGSGFLRRIGDTQLQTEARLNRFGAPDALIEQLGLVFNGRGYWDHDAFWAGESLKERTVSLGGRISLRNNITFYGSWNRSLFDFDDATYDGLWTLPDGGSPEPFRPDQSLFSGLDGTRLMFWLRMWEKVNGEVQLTWQESPVFDRSFGVPVELGEQWGGNVELNLFPTPQLQAEVGVRHERINRKRDGSRYSSATIPRIRAQYQFTRALFLRTILEYSAQEREAPLDPVTGAPLASGCDDECDIREGSDSNDFRIEGLLAFEPSPGTVFFLGYTRDMEDPSPFAFRDVEARSEGLFVKVSYRFRF
jgi:hypothetical protein